VKSPFLEIFRSPRNFLVATGLKISEVSWVYMLTVFVVVYTTTKLALTNCASRCSCRVWYARMIAAPAAHITSSSACPAARSVSRPKRRRPVLAFADEFDAVMFAFPRERIDGKFLHGHALATCPAETQAQLLNGEHIGPVEVGPDERFTDSAGRGSTGGDGIGHRRTTIGRGDAQ
jgi:hypothetical protein